MTDRAQDIEKALRHLLYYAKTATTIGGRDEMLHKAIDFADRALSAPPNAEPATDSALGEGEQPKPGATSSDFARAHREAVEACARVVDEVGENRVEYGAYTSFIARQIADRCRALPPPAQAEGATAHATNPDRARYLADRLSKIRWTDASNVSGLVAIIDPELMDACAIALAAFGASLPPTSGAGTGGKK